MISIIYQLYARVAFVLLLLLLGKSANAQYKTSYDSHFPATFAFGADRGNGFRASASLVALFTAGSADRNGFRIGVGVTVSQTVDNWIFSAGVDTYKAKQKFGIGTTFAGVEFDDGRYGASYFANKYHQGDMQVSGIVAARLNDLRINFEDDILALPFTGFKGYDRYRTAALEVRYKGFMIGTNVYTTDINGVTDLSADNSRGVYLTGKQISSPLYVGYSSHNMILRYGVNSKTGGFVGQNAWHQLFFNTPDFKTGNYKNPFLQVGIDKPYTLY